MHAYLISVRSYYLCVLCYIITYVHGVCSRSFDAHVVPCMYIYVYVEISSFVHDCLRARAADSRRGYYSGDEVNYDNARQARRVRLEIWRLEVVHRTPQAVFRRERCRRWPQAEGYSDQLCG